jgi:hypothetical protein
MPSIADNRYLAICYKPSATIRAIVNENPRQRVILLALLPSLLGVLAGVFQLDSLVVATKWSRTALRLALLVIPIYALSMLYLDGVVIR